MLQLWALLAAATAPAGDPVGGRTLALATRLVDEIGPRPAGSAAGDAALDWVERELAARGWAPRRIRPQRWTTVVACRPGQDRRVVLFLAHTDSVHARGPGANDNAAAVAVLLAAAELLHGPAPRTVCFGFPDAEELGLLGSEELAGVASTELGPLDQVVALDLVGRGELTHHGLGPGFGEDRLRALLDAAPADVPWVYRGLSQAMPHMERSDHRPFTSRGVPASHLMARSESGVDWGYHSTDDLPERLEEATLAAAVVAVVGIASAPPLPPEEPTPAFVVPGTVRVVPGAVAIALLRAAPIVSLVGLRGPWPGTRASLLGAASFLGRSVAATAAALAALVVATQGRAWDAALAGPAFAAGWCAWVAVVAAWPAVPAPVARASGVAAALAVAFALKGAVLLALPFAIAAAAVGLSGPSWGRVAALPAILPAAYLLRPDAARELAFHGLVPATLPAIGAQWLALGLIVAGAVPDVHPRARRALWMLGIAGALLAGAWGATLPVTMPPWQRGEVLWAGEATP